MVHTYITGAHGFLGKALYTSLLLKGQKISVVPHDEIQNTVLKNFDHFYYLSTSGNMWNHQDIDTIIHANVTDLIYILKQVANIPFRSFVFVSTSSVKLDVQTPYSRAKKAAEEILLTYMERYKLSIAIVRPLSITGIGEQKEHLIPTLIRSCRTGEMVNFVPYASHDYIDVQDVVAAMENLSTNGVRGIFELGWGKCYTNQEVLEIVEKECDAKANINIVSALRPYDTTSWKSTNFKSRSWGWVPQVSLTQSIREMVIAYDKQSK